MTFEANQQQKFKCCLNEKKNTILLINMFFVNNPYFFKIKFFAVILKNFFF